MHKPRAFSLSEVGLPMGEVTEAPQGHPRGTLAACTWSNDRAFAPLSTTRPACGEHLLTGIEDYLFQLPIAM